MKEYGAATNLNQINSEGVSVQVMPLQMENDLSLPNLTKLPNLLAAISLREDRNMKVYNESGEDEEVLDNRKIFLNKLGLSEKNVVGVRSMHGDNIEIVINKDCGNFICDTDGLITSQRNVYLSITVADCLPVIIFDPLKEVICLVHCGWKGLEKKIIEKAVKKITDNFNVDSNKLIGGIGPGIGRCHFDVKEDFLPRFKSYPDAIVIKDGKNYIDLKMIAKRQLEIAGIKKGNIEMSPVCTYCQSDKYFSYRKDKSSPVQAMITVAGIK